jgi:hypothetical protein
VLEKIDVGNLESLALAILPTLQHDDGVFCFDREEGGPLRGRSPRYTLMVRLGMERAVSAGVADAPLSPEVVELVRSDPASLAPGDLGLLLWSDLRAGHDAAPRTFDDLRAAVAPAGLLAGLEGMEIGWIGMGLAEAAAAGFAGADDALRVVIDHLLVERRARSGLYRHRLDDRFRQELPNFATEVYALLLLARVAGLALDDRARPAAEALAGQLVELRRGDGGWPWLYDATRGKVIEAYEVYSVHQDAMAPMAFFELSEATGDRKWAAAAVEGLPYVFGANELGVSFYDDDEPFAHRSIRRRQPWARLATVGNALVERVVGAPAPVPGGLELNRTCRPYHLGWVLEAWSGREDLVESLVPEAGS